MAILDATDRRILALLQGNARISNAEIARKVGKAASAVLERIRKLEERGVIESYDTRIDPEALGYDLTAFVQISKDSNSACRHPELDIAEIPGVQEVHVIAGEFCYLAKVRAGSMAELHDIINDHIPSIDGVGSTSSLISLRTVKESSALPLQITDESGADAA